MVLKVPFMLSFVSLQAVFGLPFHLAALAFMTVYASHMIIFLLLVSAISSLIMFVVRFRRTKFKYGIKIRGSDIKHYSESTKE